MKRCFLFISVLVIFSACGSKYNEDFAVGHNELQNNAIEQQQNMEKSLETANRIINLKEQENISSYIERRKWNMADKNGIYIEQLNNGEGELITDTNIVTLEYDCFLLNGQRFGTSEKQTVTFNAKGDTKIPFGLMSAVKNLKNKSQARIIIPSNLAFTISDEGEKTVCNNTLVYFVKIIQVR